MSNILFRCPNTGMNVQHPICEPASGARAEAVLVVHCPACARIHLINVATGELSRDVRSR